MESRNFPPVYLGQGLKRGLKRGLKYTTLLTVLIENISSGMPELFYPKVENYLSSVTMQKIAHLDASKLDSKCHNNIGMPTPGTQGCIYPHWLTTASKHLKSDQYNYIIITAVHMHYNLIYVIRCHSS